MNEEAKIDSEDEFADPASSSPADPQIDKGTWNLVNRTAIGVTFAFAVIAAFLSWQLAQLLSGLETNATTAGFDHLIEADILTDTEVSPETSMAVAMEHDFQMGRASLLRSLIASRLYLQSASLLAGMGLMVMGGALILARVREATQGKLDVKVEDSQGRKSSVELATTFPGVILALIGALTVCVTMVSSVFSQIENQDGALYFRPGSISQSSSQQSSDPYKPEIVKDENATAENVGAFLNDITGED